MGIFDIIFGSEQDRNNDAYKAGCDAGKSGDVLGDFCHDLGKVCNMSKTDEIYDKGYKEGVDHRYDKN